ncbi:pigment-dispersing hormone 1 peptides-like isoform X5 [Eriocheir sinensis]|uniref:pigment-dispersing hormone 1 peptides-like isoform X2 n=1 Tax=Eriocheir sinensis TaxID=95602 RepID=UPI0021C994CA|nr:pigment-dispersing hormone 1 peptides-like isoform X2 [Eriocheir sinensis]XP_050711459.1 pigment-dispersing hormone 1 peptides-like isoform X3 [Eriocheir sinensis]XP_050711467.1 pigment-dispersing hormone 1 peptides-like isoform X4 [Eriocheir sinensis]XP_050711472.1 pigment-dispersing hormone 1 peptides-like isoform X5 [Eriocheir sinensis]
MVAAATVSHHQVLVLLSLISSPLRHPNTLKMRKSMFMAVLMVVAIAALFTQGTQGQELKYQERETIAELARQIYRVVKGPWAAGVVSHKRNSELINSILGLPKVMNDAGRR